MGHIPVAKPSPIPGWSFPRRGLAIAFVLASMIALVAVGVTTAVPPGVKDAPLVGPKWLALISSDDLQVDSPVHIFSQRLWLVKLTSGEVLALSQKDPRLGCTVPWRPDFVFRGIKGWFRNPCHS